MAVKASRDFGWTLSDIFNPRNSRLQHFRSNLLSGERTASESNKMAPPTRMSRWTSDLSLQQQNKVAPLKEIKPHRQGSQGSQASSADSCIGSEVTSSIASDGQLLHSPTALPRVTLGQLFKMLILVESDFGKRSVT